MFILKFNGVVLSGSGNNETSTYGNRQIIAFGRKQHAGITIDSSIKWTISPQKKDPATFKPIPEDITLNDGETIEAVIFKITYSGNNNTALNGTILYIRITNANVVLGKSFIAVIENDVDQKNGQTKIEFLTDMKSPISENNKFLMKDVQDALATLTPLNITNKYFFINEEQKQFNVITLYIHTTITGSGNNASSTNTFRAKNDYLKLKENLTSNNDTINAENLPDKLNPTFQDFISIYQGMLKADPNVAIAAMQEQIDAEKAKMVKYKDILIKFVDYLGKYKTRMINHAKTIEDISKK